MTQSCLVDKIGYHIALRDSDARLLARLEEEQVKVSAGQSLRSRGDKVRQLYVVKSGWLFSYTHLPNGSRQVLHLHYPGDIVGLPDIAFDQATCSLTAAGAAVVCPFPKNCLDEIFVRSPRLSALLFSIGMVEHAVLTDRIRIMARMGARERVAHFLLEVVSRLRVTQRGAAEDYEIPLTQELIGDAVGLSNVYVSRSLTQLSRRGLISRNGRRVKLLDERGLIESVDFSDRHFRIDTSWFPDAP